MTAIATNKVKIPRHMGEVSFEIADDDRKLLGRVMDRAMALAATLRLTNVDRKTLDMDISAVHANGLPLDFQRLLDASDTDFVHDVWGITNNIDRNTAQLLNCFVPKCAKPETPNDDDPELAAARRIQDSRVLRPHRDLLLGYNFSNRSEHLQWLATATEAEILDWIAKNLGEALEKALGEHAT